MTRDLWTRRLFLTAVAGGPAVAWARGAGAVSDCSPALMTAVRRLDLPVELGQEFLRPSSDGSSPQQTEICGWVAQRLGVGQSPDVSTQDLMSLLARAIREDFGREDGLCRVNDWILSKTECHLAALKFLEEGPRNENSSAFLRPDQLPQAPLAQVRRWGPQKAEVGRTFNPQSDGGSALWFLIDRPSLQLRVFLDDIDLDTTVLTDHVTAHLVPELSRRVTARSHVYTVWLVDFEKAARQRVGRFAVRKPPPTLEAGESNPFPEGTLRKVEGWGPQETAPGRPFNLQSDGSSAFWIKTQDSPIDDLILVFGDKPLKTVCLPGVITAKLPAQTWSDLLARSGRHVLWIVSPSLQVKQRIGAFVVTPP